MELDEVEPLDGEVREAPVHEGGEVPLVVAVRHVRVETATRLRGHEKRLRPLPPQPRDEPLGEAVTVDVGGVEEIDAVVERGVERGHRFGLVGAAPLRTADAPRAETDLGNPPPRPAKSSRLHGRARRAW